MTVTRRAALRTAGGVLLAIAAGALAARLGARDDVPAAEVVRGSFSRVVSAEGTLKAVEATPITAPGDMQVPFKLAWVIDDGARVRRGDPIARFDATELERDLANGRGDRSSIGERTAMATAAADATRANLDRDATLAGDELDKARTFQPKDAEIYSRFEIISSEIDADLAQARRDHAEAVKSTRNRLSGTELDLLAIEERKAGLKVGRAESGLKGLEILAPHEGIVVLVRDWRGSPPRTGDTVWRSQKLAEIPRLDAMEAQLFVLEADAGGLAVGQRATVRVEGRPELVGARIRQVDALAKPRFRNVPVQYFSAVASLERTDPATMKPGQRVTARIVLAEAQNALVVPRQAVFESEGKRIVYRRSAWRSFEPVEVTLGAAALGRVVVERGLREGDVVAVVDPTRARETRATPPAAPKVGEPQ